MHKGKLLVAHPNLEGTVFERSVIYLYQDNDYGSAGIILNRVSQYTLKYLFDNKGLSYERHGYVYIGGPVETKSITLLHTDDFGSVNTQHVSKGICVSSDNLMLEKIAMGNEPDDWRITVGICGWSPGQLEDEIKGRGNRRGTSWLTTEADANIIFGYDGEKQWEKAVELCSRNMFDQYF